MQELVDFSAELIDPAAIREAGYAGVIGYFSTSRPGTSFGAKPLPRWYCDALRSEGLEIVSNYQYGKGATSDWYGGYDGGRVHAGIALGNHFDAGGASHRPLYAPVDSNPSREEWDRFIAPFLQGWASIVGEDWCGMYANARCIDWALADGLPVRWFWQHNWSGDTSINDHHPAAHLHQIRIDRDRVAGTLVDVNVTLRDDYGQWSRGGTVGTPLGTDLVPYREQMEARLWDDAAPTLQLGIQHTTESEGGNTNVIGYLERTRKGSYQTMIDFDGEEVRLVPDDRCAWAAMTQGNRRGVHVCAMGYARYTREEWLAQGKLLERHAQRYVAWNRDHGLPLVKIGPQQIRDGVRGICGHVDISLAFGESDHTDPGDEWPYDVVIARAKEIVGGESDMPSPEDYAKAVWAHRPTGLDGTSGATAGEILKAIDKHTGDSLDQAAGPGTKDQTGPIAPTGWPQLGQTADGHDRSLVDGVAADLDLSHQILTQLTLLNESLTQLLGKESK